MVFQRRQEPFMSSSLSGLEWRRGNSKALVFFCSSNLILATAFHLLQ